MITLTVNSPLQSLQVISDTKNTNECPIMLTYVNINPGILFSPSSIPAQFFTNSGTQTILTAPASPNYYDVKYMSVFNADVIQRTITFNLNYNTNNLTLYKCVLQVGDTVVYSNGVWTVRDVNGNLKQTMSFANQSANTVFAGPSSGSAAQPSFRTLVPADLTTNMVDSGLCEGRLTLTTGVPVTTSDVTGATTVYFTPYKGNRISLYTNSAWTLYTFTERSIALGTLASATIPNDIFIYDNAGTLTLEMVAWSSTTARATALVLQDGVYVKSGSTNKRYLGTFAPTATTTTEDSAKNRYLWNYYNRVQRKMFATNSTATWAYTSSTWRSPNAGTGGDGKLNFVIGVQESLVQAEVNCPWYCATNSGVIANVGVCLDNTNANNADVTASGAAPSAATITLMALARYESFVAIGSHFVAWVEQNNNAVGTVTFNANASGLVAGILGTIDA